jgi:tRNA modification GTPase
MNSNEDTIVAPATPLGEAGIAIVRVSGKSAVVIIDKCFRGKIKAVGANTHTAHYGKIIKSDKTILDEVVIIIFRAPHSYTGEDTVEINCHGSIFIVEQIVQEIIKRGARIAEPGEFTKRAFLNGKMDLSQAEAVAELIQSRTKISHRASINQLKGGIHVQVNTLRSRLLKFCSTLELELDFSEEGLKLIAHESLAKELSDIIILVDKLRNSYKYSKAIREGINVAIVGMPNVGKSSIFNYLIEDNRAIVTEIPGTTRDVIRETISMNGFPFNLSDTAGIRDTNDLIEIEGMRRTKGTIKTADIIIIVTDIYQYQEQNKNPADKFRNMIQEGSRVIVVVNKIDLYNGTIERPSARIRTILASALTGYGMKELEKEIFNKGVESEIGNIDKKIVIINARHHACLNNAMNNLSSAQKSLENNVSNEFIAIDIRAAIRYLDEIIGNISNEEILNNIFTNFCIGK